MIKKRGQPDATKNKWFSKRKRNLLRKRIPRSRPFSLSHQQDLELYLYVYSLVYSLVSDGEQQALTSFSNIKINEALSSGVSIHSRKMLINRDTSDRQREHTN